MLRLVAVAVCLAGVVSITHSKKRMNVLMFASDDLRPQLGCYQPEAWAGRHVAMHTPNIDALANRSVVFLRSYCQQVCTPSNIHRFECDRFQFTTGSEGRGSISLDMARPLCPRCVSSAVSCTHCGDRVHCRMSFECRTSCSCPASTSLVTVAGANPAPLTSVVCAKHVASTRRSADQPVRRCSRADDQTRRMCTRLGLTGARLLETLQLFLSTSRRAATPSSVTASDTPTHCTLLLFCLTKHGRMH